MSETIKPALAKAAAGFLLSHEDARCTMTYQHFVGTFVDTCAQQRVPTDQIPTNRELNGTYRHVCQGRKALREAGR